MKGYILFVVTSFWAYGELSIALETVRRIKNAGYSPLFFIPPSHQNIVKSYGLPFRLLIPGSRKLNQIILKDIYLLYKPASVILADLLNFFFCERHYGLIWEDLFILKCRIGAFDLYSLNSSVRKMDTFGFESDIISKINYDCIDYFLEPCPLLLPYRSNKKHSCKYSLFDFVEQRTEERKIEYRNSLSINENQKIVLITTSEWQDARNKNNEVQCFLDECNKNMENILLGLGNNVLIYSVGKRVLFKKTEPKLFKHFNKLLPNIFNQLVNSADLFISNNHISTSMLKYTLSGIPIVLLQNSYLKNDKFSVWVNSGLKVPPEQFSNLSFAYPFRMFPVGWYKFLDELVNHNLFYELTNILEILDVDVCIQNINNIINGKMQGNLKKHEKYKTLLKNLDRFESFIINEVRSA
jgi:hypothetical protein